MIYKIGSHVKVVMSTETEDDTFDQRYMGQRGVIVEIKTGGYTGETEEDPLYVVEFDDIDIDGGPLRDEHGPRRSFDDSRLLATKTNPKRESFWTEELVEIVKEK